MMKNLFLPLFLFFLLSSCSNSRNKSIGGDSIDNSSVYINKIDSLKKAGYSIVDYHAHLKGGLTVEQLLEHSKKTGIKYGIAVNGGLGFPVTNDTSLMTFYRSMKNFPGYLAVQGEGREWYTLFSKDSIQQYDYTFTDAMTYTDAKGRRMRLWINDEVWVDDKNEFMDYLVKTAVEIIITEPIDIYVNPTYLPEILQPEYDKLWTEERMDKIIEALADKAVALEINARFKIPSEKFIKKAKAAGVKFTLGTNNVTADLGYLEYALDMITKCSIQPCDLWNVEKKKEGN